MKTSRIASLAAFLAGLSAAPAVFADCTTPQTFEVTSPNDDGGTGTLRFLINSASVQDCDTIHVPAMLIVLDSASGQIQIKKSITIAGDGAEGTIIDGNGGVSNQRIFEIDPDDKGLGVVIQGVTLRNGYASGDQGGAILIDNSASLRLVDSLVKGNKSDNEGGGISIGSVGSLSVENSTVSENDSSSDGGGINVGNEPTPEFGGTLIVSGGSVIDSNHSSGSGAGVYVHKGNAEVLNSKITNNTADNNGGGLLTEDHTAARLVDSEISGNTADGDGGGLYDDELMTVVNCLIENNKTINDNDGAGIYVSTVALITDSTFKGNRAEGDGGGIYNSDILTIVNTTVSGNIADSDNNGSGGDGGGIYNNDYLHIITSAINDNTANTGTGGGIHNADYLSVTSSVISGNTTLEDDGAGIFDDGEEQMIIADSLFANNYASGDDGSEDNDGGAIYNNGSEEIIANTTFFGNKADGSGGALFNDNNSRNATFSLNNVTITQNVADANEGGLTDGDGGGIANPDLDTSGNNYPATVAMTNSIVAGNVDASAAHEAPDCSNVFTGTDANFTVSGPNVIQNLDGCELSGEKAAVDQVDPLLESALADNSGPSVGDIDTPSVLQTVALQSGSPAIDAGNDNTCEGNDQRGVDRPLGEHCDLGAFEAAASSGGTTGGDTTGGDTTGGSTTGGSSGSGGCSLIR